MADFDEASSTVYKRWIGKEGIMVPTIEHLARDAIRGKRVLDIGCGDGYLLNHYIRWGAKEVVAIDANAEAIKICYFEQDDLRMDGRIDFRFMDPRAMNFQSEFDIAMAIFVLQFAETAEELQKILHNTAKALKTGGQLFGYVPNGVSDLKTTNEEAELLGATWSFSGPHPLDGEVGKVRLYGHQHDTVFEEPITFFYRETYDRLQKHAGFRRIEWFSPCPSKDAEKEYGAEVLNHFLHPPKDIMFRAVKHNVER
ncbi:CRE-PRMT-6 protein [Aphelenchoides avenae]|nr:CRE-PRMT-6 protein [Aphelenchus avenae]